MKRERGLALGQMLLWGFMLAIVAVLAMKAVPSVIEYYTIMKNIKTVANQAGASSTVAQVRSAYAKYAEIDNTKSVEPNDLEIYKESGQIAISFSYSEKIPLVGAVSLVIDYEGSATGGGRN